METFSLLILDRHRLYAQALANLLEQQEWIRPIALFTQFSEAMTYIKVNSPRIVLIDMNLVETDVFLMCQEILSYTANTSIIGLVTPCRPALAQQLIRAGTKGLLTKRSSKEELLIALNEVRQGRTYICADLKNMKMAITISEKISSLGKKELAVIVGIREGLTSREIALKLGVTRKTIEVHRYNIIRKLQVKNTAALVNLISQEGL